MYDRGSLFASVHLYPRRFLRKIDRNDHRYARRGRNSIKVYLRTIGRVNSIMQKFLSTFSAVLVAVTQPPTPRHPRPMKEMEEGALDDKGKAKEYILRP